ncbi:hypothetical protein CAPTEDRAFT_208892 [Capitella teleta]|uniref:Ig-like domain-containing protein n=1 Tax=Capitella teleta TaxID=283909 RepID=R7UXP4_CAPTE|nr:hypothetical protein CAPTEDRAFT_208892 [Capitella teleta]|eukprot:ELU08171.1 hypothetical protein CAPTEDRAFT_208892 [Capitella teleta]
MGSLQVINLLLVIVWARQDYVTTFLFQAVSLFTMLTEGEVIISKEGDEVSLPCNFILENFSKFHNPILWHKHQRGEVTRVNMGGNVLSPFRATKRLHLAFRESSPRYSLELSLSDISLQDSGNYSCVIRGPGNDVIGQVTHYIFVRAAVEKLFFMDYTKPGGQEVSSGGILTMTDGQPFQFACVSIGGYPPPDITIYADQDNITGLFTFERLTQLVGAKAMKLIVSEIVASNEMYTPSRADDGIRLKCHAEVVDAPLISCQATEAELGQRNAYIKCFIEAKPALKTIFWNLDAEGTSLIPGNIVNDMWTIVIVREKFLNPITDQDATHVDVHLYMRIVTEESFRDYVICAVNAIDASTQKVSLIQKAKKQETTIEVKRKQPVIRFVHRNNDSLDTQPLVEETKYSVTSSQSTGTASSWLVACVLLLTWLT